MTLFCSYSDSLGRPGEGVHKERLLGMASVDVRATVLFALFVNLALGVPFCCALFTLLLVAELMHYLFCVDTAVMRWLRN